MRGRLNIERHLMRQKGGGYSVKLSRMLLLILAFLLCSSILTRADSGEAMCKDLKPFNNIDELLYQFYANLDNDCLFKMPAVELEKIWEIRILSEERAKKGRTRYLLRNSSEFENKPYKSEIDAFYVEIDRDEMTDTNVFMIRITTAYADKHYTLFPDGNYPKLLPNPLKRSRQRLVRFGNEGAPGPPPLKNPGVYKLDDRFYYWVSSGKTRIISLSGGYSAVTGVLMRQLQQPLD